uniref:Tail protein n=1 Tax=viral metagenome TaxID=1070528 RepID=A0A6M3IG88_9ZZZZ
MAGGTISTDNLTLGGAQLFFHTTIAHADLLTATSFADDANSLGNIITSGITPEVTYIEHTTSRKGKSVKDKVAAGMSTIRINFTFDEINSTNLGRFFMGAVSAGKVNVFSSTLDEGSAMLLVDTDIGRDMVYRIPKCTVRPDGELSLTPDTWHSAPLVIEVLEYQNGDTTNGTNNATWLAFPFGRVDVSNL